MPKMIISDVLNGGDHDEDSNAFVGGKSKVYNAKNLSKKSNQSG